MCFLACHENVEGVYYYLFQGGAVVASLAVAAFGLTFIRKSYHESLIRSRIAKGECVRCGYPLGAREKCSECGCAASPLNEQD